MAEAPRPRRDLSDLRIHRDPSDERTSPGGRTALAIAGVVLVALVAGGLVVVTRSGAFRPEVRVDPVRLERPRSGAGTLLTTTGHVVARRKASVSARRAGRLVALEVEEGSQVTEGQVLARVDGADVDARLATLRSEAVEARARLAAAEARRDVAATEASRARSLQEAGVASRSAHDVASAHARSADADLAEARAAVASAQARIAAAEVDVEQSLVRAPFDGVVLRKEAEVGESVAPAIASGQLTRGAIVTMADLRSLEIEADVGEARIGLISEGTPAEVAVDAVPSRRYRGRVRQVIPTADRQKATVQVKVALLDADERVRPEMEAKVTFLGAEPDPEALARPPVLTASARAIRVEGSTAHAWVVEDGRARRRVVEVGETMGDRMVVTAGLSDGESVVLDPPADLEDGDAVRVEA